MYNSHLTLLELETLNITTYTNQIPFKPSHQQITCSLHDIAEKLLIWH
jgi:hypothetical protein